MSAALARMKRRLAELVSQTPDLSQAGRKELEELRELRRDIALAEALDRAGSLTE
jgi:hypothetical protein